jgi:hypothetical protein
MRTLARGLGKGWAECAFELTQIDVYLRTRPSSADRISKFSNVVIHHSSPRGRALKIMTVSVYHLMLRCKGKQPGSWLPRGQTMQRKTCGLQEAQQELKKLEADS